MCELYCFTFSKNVAYGGRAVSRGGRDQLNIYSLFISSSGIARLKLVPRTQRRPSLSASSPRTCQHRAPRGARAARGAF